VRPAILGTLLDAVSGALRRMPNVELPRKPRLADFAVWVTAAEPLLGLQDGAFIRAYAHNQASANDLTLEASPIAGAVQTLVDGGTFEGTASDLLRALAAHADDAVRSQKCWPTNGRMLSNALRRLAPNLRNCGIEITFSRDSARQRRRLITIRNVASASSAASEEPCCITHRESVDTTNELKSGSGGQTSEGKDCSHMQDLHRRLDHADDADAGIQKSRTEEYVVGHSPDPVQQRSKRRVEGEL
jgi:hypothetical protein